MGHFTNREEVEVSGRSMECVHVGEKREEMGYLGLLIRDSTAPRLSARVKIFNDFKNALMSTSSLR